MKTRLTPWGLSLCASAVIPWLAGCQKSEVRVQSAPAGPTNTSVVAVASAPVVTNVTPLPAAPLQAAVTAPPTPPAPAPGSNTVGTVAATNAPLQLEKEATQVATPPPKPIVPPVKLTPEMLEVVRLAHANVGDQVLKEFIAGINFSTDLTADEIVFLKDIGISDDVVTSILQRRREGVAQGFARGGTAVAAQGAEAQGQPTVVAAGPPQLPPTTNTAVVTSSLAPAQQPAQVQMVQAAETQVVTVPQQVTQNYFYDSLTPYGSWMYVTDYGWCWRPTVATLQVGWRPYCDSGRWLWTDCGWYWQSDYSWGWAPFHYGRWHMAGPHGWVWIPGHEWGPAWVTWRQTSTHCGWAPLPPGAHFRAGVGLTFNGVGVSVGFGFGLGHSHYNFVPLGHLHDSRLRSHVVPSTHVAQVYNNSTVINNYVVGNNNTIVNGGISADKVSIASRSEIRRVSLREIGSGEAVAQKADRLERNGSTLAVYKPQVPPLAPQPPARTQNPGSTRTAERGSGAVPGASQNLASGGPNPATIPSLAGIPLAAPSNARPAARPAASSSIAAGSPSIPATVPRPASSSSASRVQQPPTPSGASSISDSGTLRRTDERGAGRAPVNTTVPQRNSLAPSAQPSQVTPRGTENPAVPNPTPARRFETRDSVRSSSGLLAQPQPHMIRQEAPAPTIPQSPVSSREPGYRQGTVTSPANGLSGRAVENPGAVPNPRYEPRSPVPSAPTIQYNQAPSVPNRPVPGASTYTPQAPASSSRPVPGASSYSPPPSRSYEAPRPAPAAPSPAPRYEAPRTAPAPPSGSGSDSRNERGGGRNRPN